MKIIEQFRSLWIAWKDCFKALRHMKIFSWFMLYGLLQVVFLLVLVYYVYPPISMLVVPVVKKFFGELALHYPTYFLVLPTLFSWVNLILGGIIGILIVGVTTTLFARSYRQKTLDVKTSLKWTWSKYLILFSVWAVESACSVFILLKLPLFLRNLSLFENRGFLSIQFVTTIFAIIVGAFFAYTTALIVLDNEGVLSALKRSFLLFIKYPLISILLVAIPNFIKLPLDLLSGKADLIISKFNPEMVVIILGLSIIVAIFANFFLVGTVTRYFLYLHEKRY